MGHHQRLWTPMRAGAGDLDEWWKRRSDGHVLKCPTDVAIVTNVDPKIRSPLGHSMRCRTRFAIRRKGRSMVFAVMGTDPSRGAEPSLARSRLAASSPTAENPQATAAGRSCAEYSQAAARKVNVVFRNRKPDATHERIRHHAANAGTALHNASNDTAADRGLAHELGFQNDAPPGRFAGFGGVQAASVSTKNRRRNGVNIIDDYGHHPVEIAAC